MRISEIRVKQIRVNQGLGVYIFKKILIKFHSYQHCIAVCNFKQKQIRHNNNSNATKNFANSCFLNDFRMSFQHVQ